MTAPEVLRPISLATISACASASCKVENSSPMSSVAVTPGSRPGKDSGPSRVFPSEPGSSQAAQTCIQRRERGGSTASPRRGGSRRLCRRAFLAPFAGTIQLANADNGRLARTLLRVGIGIFVWTWMSKPLLSVPVVRGAPFDTGSLGRGLHTQRHMLPLGSRHISKFLHQNQIWACGPSSRSDCDLSVW